MLLLLNGLDLSLFKCLWPTQSFQLIQVRLAAGAGAVQLIFFLEEGCGTAIGDENTGHEAGSVGKLRLSEPRRTPLLGIQCNLFALTWKQESSVLLPSLIIQ